MRSLFVYCLYEVKFKWCMTRLVVQNKHQKDMCYDEVGTHKIPLYVGSYMNTIDHLIRESLL